MSTSNATYNVLSHLIRACICVLALEAGNVAYADFEQLDGRVMQIKRGVLELGADMRMFERFAIYPDEKRLSIFLTMDVGRFFDLQKVKIKLNDEWVMEQAFRDFEAEGLENGAAVRVFVGNIDKGPHKLLAFFEGIGPRGRHYKRGLTHRFIKADKPVFIEMRVNDKEQRLQPEFLVNEW